MTIAISKLMSTVSCEIIVTGLKTWKVRFYFGSMLFKLGARIMGMKGTVKIGNETMGEIK
jgi:hypothetical protein